MAHAKTMKRLSSPHTLRLLALSSGLLMVAACARDILTKPGPGPDYLSSRLAASAVSARLLRPQGQRTSVAPDAVGRPITAGAPPGRGQRPERPHSADVIPPAQ